MLTFAEFSNLIEFDRDIRSCASLLAESEVDPAEFVGSFLEEDLQEGWKDWLTGAGKVAGNVASGIGRLGRAAGEVGSSLWDGGLKSGVAKGADTVAGPSVKFDKALAMLNDLAAYLHQNDMTRNLPSAGKSGYTVAMYIKAVAGSLKKEKNNMPQMQKAQVSQGMAARDGGASAAALQTPQTVGGPINNVSSSRPPDALRRSSGGNPTMRKVV
jgi:hypothetical protein